MFSPSGRCWQIPSWIPGSLDFMLRCDPAKTERTLISEGKHGGKQSCLARRFFFLLRKPMLKDSIQDGCCHKISEISIKLTDLKVAQA